MHRVFSAVLVIAVVGCSDDGLTNASGAASASGGQDDGESLSAGVDSSAMTSAPGTGTMGGGQDSTGVDTAPSTDEGTTAELRPTESSGEDGSTTDNASTDSSDGGTTDGGTTDGGTTDSGTTDSGTTDGSLTTGDDKGGPSDTGAPTTGPGKVSCSLAEPCIGGLVCDYPDDMCGSGVDGTCYPLPPICGLVFDPVCGCDGNDYGNACQALAGGTDTAYNGMCS